MVSLLVIAFAAEPVLDLHAGGTFRPEAVAGGLGGAVGLHLGRADLALAADGAMGGETLAFVRPRLHLFAADPHATTAHLLVGAGVLAADDRPTEALEVGLGVDIGQRPTRPRLQVGVSGWPQLTPTRGFVTFGLVHRPARRPDPTSIVEPNPVFDAARVWVPGPVCEWLPPDDASERFPETAADPALATQIARPGALSAEEPEAGPRGDLVVTAWPGDQVTVDGAPQSVAADGVAWVRVLEGPVDVWVTGNGRQIHETLAVAADATLWFDAGEPTPLRVTFAAGSDRLDADALAALDRLAAWAGDAAFDVWGSFSPEGTEAANLALADRRAAAVVEALAARGVPADRLHRTPHREPEPGADPAWQRAAGVSLRETP